ncbi:MAG: protein kinase [Myxococcota bacterium]|jgi:serine/threonine-protein kinase|nr:protein kinase [Myxococcota bacterium]
MAEQVPYDPRASEILPSGTMIVDRYRIVRHLAAGGMARVYIAQQEPLKRNVALKLLHREYCQNESMARRFFREAVAISQLAHPNTIKVFDFGRTADSNFFIAMELLDGETLRARLQNVTMMHAEHAIPIAVQVARSLAEAHRKGIVHRDLKPDNIFLTNVEHDFVKVLDFGIASFREIDERSRLTQDGAVPGTPEYMSPEQAAGQELDGRSDLYALGVVLFEMLSGRPPFAEPKFLATLLKHVQEPPPPLPAGVPSAVAAFVRDRALAKNPLDRPHDSDAFVLELEDAALLSGLRLDRSSRPPSIAREHELQSLRAQLEIALSRQQELEQALQLNASASGVVPIAASSMANVGAEAAAQEPPPAMRPNAMPPAPVSVPSAAAVADPEPPPSPTAARRMPPPPQRQAARPSPHTPSSVSGPVRGVAVQPPPAVAQARPFPQRPNSNTAPIYRGKAMDPFEQGATHADLPIVRYADEQEDDDVVPGSTRVDWASPIDTRRQPAPSAPPPQPQSKAPQINVSQALMTFAEPILRFVGSSDAERVQQALVFAKSVWNSVNRSRQELDEARAYVAEQLPQMLKLFDELVDRKRMLYPEEFWLVDDIAVTQKGTGIAIQVKVVVPG